MDPRISTLANWLARKAVKEEWRAENRIVQTIPTREVAMVARAYLDAHPAELIAEATSLCAELSINAPKRRR